MNQSGNHETGPGLGRRPANGWPQFRAPGEDDQASPSAQPRPAQGYAQPWQPSTPAGGRHPLAFVVIAVAVAVALVVAISVILVTRHANRPQPVRRPASTASAPTDPSPSSPSGPTASSRPATDELATALIGTGLACVGALDDPVINICENKPSDSYTEVRWMDDDHGRMISFQIYARYRSDHDRMELTKRVQMLQLAGLEDSSVIRITRALASAKKYTTPSDLATSWGSVNLQYVGPAHAVQLLGDRRGHTDASYDGKIFDANPGSVMKTLRRQGYACTLESQALTCTHGEVYLSLYGTGRGMTTIYLSQRNPAADKVLLGLLPAVLGGDLATVRPLVQTGMRRAFYLGAVSGYVVIANTGYVSIEAINW